MVAVVFHLCLVKVQKFGLSQKFVLEYFTRHIVYIMLAKVYFKFLNFSFSCFNQFLIVSFKSSAERFKFLYSNSCVLIYSTCSGLIKLSIKVTGSYTFIGTRNIYPSQKSFNVKLG
jgi:hypothetical protein